MASRPNLTRPLLAVSATAISAMALWLFSKRAERHTRRAKYTCSCGKIEANLVIPAANYRYMEAPSFQCTCVDCVEFCDAALKNGSANMTVFCSPGAPNMILFDSEIQVVKGMELLKSMKLSTKSPNRRVYSICCGTPMGISPAGSGLSLIYLPNIKPPDELGEGEVALPKIAPWVCLYHDKAQPDKPKCPPETKIIKGSMAPGFIGHCLSRMALLAVLGEKGPGEGLPVVGEVDVGIDSIAST